MNQFNRPSFSDEKKILTGIHNNLSSAIHAVLTNTSALPSAAKENFYTYITTHSVPEFDKKIKKFEDELNSSLDSLLPVKRAYVKLQKELCKEETDPKKKSTQTSK